MFIQITTQTFQVTVNSTFYARNIIGGYMAYGFEYNATMTGYNVIIRKVLHLADLKLHLD